MTATAQAMPARKIVVGIGDAKLARADRKIITYALGSCIGVTAFDPVSRIGGLVHVLLPDSRTSPDKARANPWLCMDIALPAFFRQLIRAGCRQNNLVVRAAGAAELQMAGRSMFEIGRRNQTMLRKILWQQGIVLRGQDLGGNQSRTMALDTGTGRTSILSNGSERFI